MLRKRNRGFGRARTSTERLMAIATLLFSANLAGAAQAQQPIPPLCIPGSTGIDDRCEIWVSTYDEPSSHQGNGWDFALDMASSRGGHRVYVTGASESQSGDLDYVTVALNAETGNQVWAARRGGSGGLDDGAYALAVSPDGTRLYVTGTTDAEALCVVFAQNCGTDPSAAGDFLTIAYDAQSGNELWRASHDGPWGGGDLAVDVAVSADGSELYVLGTSAFGGYQSDEESEVGVVAYSALSGAEIWSRTLGGGFYGVDRAVALAVDPAGSAVYVSASSSKDLHGIDADYWTFALRTEGPPSLLGDLLWSDRTGGAGSETPVGLLASPDGDRLFVTGHVASGPPPRGVLSVAYSTETGSRLWTRTDANATTAQDMVLDPAGDRLFVTGHDARPFGGVSYGSTQFVTLSYDGASGTPLWVSRYSTAEEIGNRAFSISVSPAGDRVFVSGVTVDAWARCATVAYAANDGSQQWVARYNTLPDVDTECRMSSAAEGGLYVLGDSTNLRDFTLDESGESSGNQSDFVVLAYGLN